MRLPRVTARVSGDTPPPPPLPAPRRPRSKCLTPPCHTLHQAHKSSQRRRCRFHFPIFYFFHASQSTELKGPIPGQRRKRALEFAQRGSGSVGEAGAPRLGGRPALRDWLAFHPGRLPALPKACFCPAALNSHRSALQTCWFLADPLHRPRRVAALWVSLSLPRSK